MSIALDEIDVQLLVELSGNADRPNMDLARIVGLSPAATLHRVRRLKENGVVRRLVADVDAGKAGFPLHDALLEMVARNIEDLQRVQFRLTARVGVQRITTLLRMSELKPPSPLPFVATK